MPRAVRQSAQLRFAGISAPPAGRHHCHAQGCTVPVPPKLLMCLKCWRLVPREIQRRVWAAYRPGQEMDKRPSEAWHEAAAAAIQAVALAERGA